MNIKTAVYFHAQLASQTLKLCAVKPVNLINLLILTGPAGGASYTTIIFAHTEGINTYNFIMIDCVT